MTANKRNRVSLKVQDNDGNYRAASSDEIISAAQVAINRRFKHGTVLSSPAKSQEYLKLKLATLEHEVFTVLWLDNRHRIIAFKELFQGTIDGASVYPREVVKSALEYNAAACIFSHNHPSGVAEPSQADQYLTKQLKDALSLIDVRVLDHIIVGEDCTSFAERGLL